MDKRFIAVLVAGLMGAGSAMAADVGANTTIGGQIFADFGDVDEQSDGTKVPPSGTGFDVKRAYLIVNHTFNDVLSANLTTDAQYISSTSGTGYSSSSTASSGGVTELFIKLLYLQARFNDAFVFHAGSYNSPWTSYVQNLYGYRYVEKVETDRLGYASTADWGLNATGVAGGNGWFNYSVSVVDGGGYKNPTRTDDVDFEAAVGFKPVNWLNLGAGFYNGHLGQVTAATTNYASNTASRWDLVAAVVTGGIRVGAEYFDAKNYKSASASTGVLSGPGGVVVATNVTTADPTGSVKSDEADGYSAWASYAFVPQWSVFARYDEAKPSKDYDPELKDQYFNVGVAYKPLTALDLALVYKHEKVTDGSISIGGGDGNASYTIGGTGVA
ncbi:MAG TPA: hypothetical protein VHX52_07360, partial [Steroidobacteraceae bacterium]|nr:hypothetical protein [Steroidobacteraceae bacterium]